MKDAFDRIYDVCGCSSQIDLAKVLEIRQSSISDAKRRNSIPSEWLIKILRAEHINPDWILDGESARYRVMSETLYPPHLVHLPEVRPPQDCSPMDLIRELFQRAFETKDYAAIQKAVADSWCSVVELNMEEFNNPSVTKNLDLVKLVKDYGIFTPSDDKEDAILQINMAAAGCIRPHRDLYTVISSLYPNYIPDGENIDKEGVLTVYLIDKVEREKNEANKVKRSQEIHRHIDKSAIYKFFGDTDVPDLEKEVICKIVFDIVDYFDVPSTEYEGIEAYFWSTAKLYLSNFDWSFASGAYVVKDSVHVVLISKAFWKGTLIGIGNGL